MAAGPASAADLAARPVYKAPPMVAPVYDWTGFYIGLNGGGGSSHKCWDINNIDGVGPIIPVAEGCHDATGGLAGGQIGYRWQAANWVFGVEAQGDWADLSGSNTSALAILAGIPTFTNQSRIHAIGLFTGQVGYAWNNVLAYVKGGAAATHDKYNGIVGGIAFGAARSEPASKSASLRIGRSHSNMTTCSWAAATSFNGTAAFGGGFSRIDNIRQDVDMGTVRLNYTFGGPAVSRY